MDRLKKRLAKINMESKDEKADHARHTIEEIELTEEQIAKSEAAAAVFVEHLSVGSGEDPTLSRSTRR